VAILDVEATNRILFLPFHNDAVFVMLLEAFSVAVCFSDML
jgi:hypothetical protein